jgi:hypothetical protein
VSKGLFNFYNIMLERHMNDPDGYDILIVDPILKGSFGSRLSHSCDPNCATVASVSMGKYVISMYAIKPIQQGEELTFDYCSVTESAKENKEAVCLCGTSQCRGSYLSLIKDNSVTPFILTHHSFLHRMSLILNSCMDPELTEEDCESLRSQSIGACMLDGAPKWLTKWIASIARLIGSELDGLAEDKMQQAIIKDCRL